MPEQPPNNQEQTPRPVATDSGDEGGQVLQTEPSAGEQRAESAPSDINREQLQQRVLETEAWVKRLKEARAEGTRLSQENARAPGQQQQQRQQQPQDPQGRVRTDVDYLLDVLNKGDDRGFVTSVLDAAERRTINRFATEENNRALATRITQIVDEHAPDVPMDLFWAYTEDAIRVAPNDVAAQIEAAIKLSRRALATRDEKMKTRRDANTTNRQRGDTLEGSRDRPTRGAGSEDEDSKRTMVDDIKAYQNSRR